ncbi:MAG: penicillin acylase family protein [Chloroflexi bacterium AL-W]|nr:penicillin acylase family protein [Chloroflexi bacterium AL-N1]NOK67632.1 penicillin acylase family protein [Chloroflexi bacterium AL-N10]NOK75598.1 penicillin acylase family protein [Chloroflexi bacterium AL-N5]NOK82386.1 penicillin acylase family protein [Chloroflexi bacterium AL-W]NOK90231.1 penicillin acylase family protein [Chloroflexi bacterium AL-N15]
MRGLLKWLRWGFVCLTIFVVVIGSSGYFWLRQALPEVSGSIQVDGISAPVEILRDLDGMVHIQAQNETDALFGLGYAHAQDRLWQMEFQRRIGYGRLSEVLGEAALETDMFLRTLGVARAAHSTWAATPPEERVTAEAYVKGVNAFIESPDNNVLPIEFVILGFEPDLWQPEDILVWGKMMSWDLGGNWRQELLRSRLSNHLDAERAEQLMPSYTADGPLILPVSEITGDTPRLIQASNITPIPESVATSLMRIDKTLQTTLGLGGRSIGSNNWVVGGARTTTGQPLLADDPHLGSQIPSIWYLAHIQGGELDAIGATFPGVPGVIIGRNNHIAWGVTNTGPDVQDLYIERVNDQNEAEYNGIWEPMQIIPETIKIDGQPDIEIDVRITRHGPLISDVVEDIDEPLAFRWTALDPIDNTLLAFTKINKAQNWEEFTSALADYHAPMQNFVYADVEGNIGYYAPGALPIRSNGEGKAPVPGWTDEYAWEGYVPFDELPQTFNPSKGFIVSANNKVIGDDYPYLISTNWASPHRAARITELIERTPQLSIDDMQAIHADVQSLQAVEMLPYMLQIQSADPQKQMAIALLRDWDGSMDGDSAEAALYHAWYQQLTEHIFADELGEELWMDYRDDRSFIAMALIDIFEGNNQTWCDDIQTAQTEDCEAMIEQSLEVGLDNMAQAQGTESIENWRWDNVHHAKFPHSPFDDVSMLRPMFSRSIPNGGDGFTVNVAPPDSEDPYHQHHIPSYRHVVDLGNLNASLFIHSVGQSGHVFSTNYNDLLERWQRVEYLPMSTEIDRNSVEYHQLILTP